MQAGEPLNLPIPLLSITDQQILSPYSAVAETEE
jgi:hypothetical protein